MPAFRIIIKLLGLILLNSPNAICETASPAPANQGRPLRIVPEDAGIKLSSPRLDFSFNERQEAIFGVRSFKLKEALLKRSLSEPKEGFGLYAQWGTADLQATQLQILSGDGTPLAENLWKITKKTEDSIEFLLQKEVQGLVRACAVEISPDGQISLCTPTLDLATGNNPPENEKAKFFINGSEQKKPISAQTEFGQILNITIDANSGSRLEVQSIALPIVLHEVFENSQGDIEITASGAPPLAPVNWITADRGIWQHTIGDTRRFFSIVLKKGESKLRVIGGAGMVYSFDLQFSKLPNLENRIYARQPVANSTYSDKVRIQLEPQSNGELKSAQESILQTPNGAVWTYSAASKDELNKAKLESNWIDKKNQPQTTIFDHDVYRGSSTFISARAGFSLSTKGRPSLVSDFEINHWFEKVLVDNDWTTRRWALSAGYLDTAQTNISDSKYKLAHIDILYRFTPGVTSWDETFGLVAGTTFISFLDEDHASFMGMGLFWSRSLPQWFNYLFGWTEFLRGPKWTELQLVNYFSSSSSDVTGNSTQLRAAGRIAISKNTYFEGGWALISGRFESRQTQINFAIGRAFLGIGYQF